jgi:transcriptional regulator with XRE-family HTH domain
LTPFALLTRLAGLSLSEAARFLGVRRDTVNSWSSGRNRTPPGVLAQLRDLVAMQERAAAEALRLIASAESEAEIELGYPADDHEAQALGWPCVGAWFGMAARVVAGTDRPVILVPRGSTVATAAAAEAHER